MKITVKTKDLGEIGEDLASLVVELKTIGEPEKKGIAGFFQKKKNELEKIKLMIESGDLATKGKGLALLKKVAEK